MSQSYCNLIYHLVFSTKSRQAWLDDEISARVHAYLGGGIRDEGGMALIINGTADHVHVLARLRQDKAVSDVLRNIKSSSSGWIHRTFPKAVQFNWQAGYGAFTVSPSQIEKTRRYILEQEQHHKRRSFQDEFIALLEAHGIEYDEMYICG